MSNYLSEKARGLIPYVAGIQPQEPGWIKLNTNENPYPPSPRVLEAISRADIGRLRLYPDGDSNTLCQQIATHLPIPAEYVFAANSSDEVLAFAFGGFFSGKANVMTPDISYGFYPVWAEMYDAGTNIMPLRADYTIDPHAYKGADGVILANPNAPTGIALSLDKIETIIRQNQDSVVIIDEAYIDFAAVESAVNLVETYENLLVIRTFSKSHSLAGLRVGYAVGQPHLIDGLQRMKNAFNSYPLDMLAQMAAAAAISDRAYWDETRSRIIQTREQTSYRLCELGYPSLPSQANFLFVRAERAKALYDFLLEHKILVRYWSKSRLDQFLRVTMGTDEEMEAFLSCVKQF
ncbi:MAG: aminotransferase class I/II-fold pyridoxal phosphate-dependent enzyme [Oscillospiraceae bacterium]|nr:aminotransferase class I/II-fold pyridoxal phosphate-dependent enzyme [Oscillospiraceae bacterium]